MDTSEPNVRSRRMYGNDDESIPTVEDIHGPLGSTSLPPGAEEGWEEFYRMHPDPAPDDREIDEQWAREVERRHAEALLQAEGNGLMFKQPRRCLKGKARTHLTRAQSSATRFGTSNAH